MISQDAKNFKPRRSFRRLGILMAGFGIIVPIGLVLYFSTGENAALFTAAFGLLSVLYMLFRGLAAGAEYSINKDGVFLKWGRSKRMIPFQDIRGAAVLSSEQAQGVVKQYLAPTVKSERELDMRGHLAASRMYGYFTQYCTVPIVQEMTTRGNKRNIVKYGTKLAGKFILLKLTSGDELLISPEDCGGFFNALWSRTRLLDTSPVSSYTCPTDPVRGAKLKKFFKWHRLLAFSAVFAVILVAGITKGFLNPGEDRPEAQETAVQTGWIDGDTFRYMVNIRFETTQEDPDLRQQELLESAADANHSALVSLLLGWYCGERGIDPDDEQYPLLHDTLEQLFLEHKSNISLDPVKKGKTELNFPMKYSGPNLRKNLQEILDETLALQGL